MAVPKIAKITRPLLSQVFPRKRLFEVLDRGRKRPVTWIVGLPGCGKTTLVSSYLDARKLPCLWYQVDQGDVDPATFFYYLGLAALAAAPHKRKSLPLLTPEYRQGMSAFTLRFFEDLFARLKIPSAVIFDNYQEVPQGASEPAGWVTACACRTGGQNRRGFGPQLSRNLPNGSTCGGETWYSRGFG